MLTRKAFQYRLYPTPPQEQTLLFVLRRCRHLYNSALEQRKAYDQMRRKSLGYSQQAAELAAIKAAYPAYGDIRVLVLQDAAPPGQSVRCLLSAHQERGAAGLSALSGARTL
jgi:putative transposase